MYVKLLEDMARRSPAMRSTLVETALEWMARKAMICSMDADEAVAMRKFLTKLSEMAWSPEEKFLRDRIDTLMSMLAKQFAWTVGMLEDAEAKAPGPDAGAMNNTAKPRAIPRVGRREKRTR